MAAYRQEVRKLEEKLDGFKLHHILWRDNEAANTLAQLGSSHEPPPLGVFMQDLFNSSIRHEEDNPASTPETPTGVQKKKGKHKLTPPWEGSYLVTEII
jgi:hypothetical protein